MLSYRFVLLFMLSGALMAICLGQVTSRPTKDAEAAIWIESQITRRLSDSGISGGLATHPFHYIFLFDSSHASSKSAFRKYAGDAIQEFLKRRAAEPSAERSRFSVYPYQVELYADAANSISAQQLTLPNIRAIDGKLPTSPLGRAPVDSAFATESTDPKDFRGHDHIGARKKAAELVGRESTNSQSLPNIYIQFTTTSFSEVPGHQEIDRVVRNMNSASDGLEGTGLVAFPLEGFPPVTENPDENTAPFTVLIWIFGPQSFDGIDTVLSTTHSVHKETTSTRPSPSVPAIFGALCLLAIVAYLLYLLCKPVRIGIGRGGSEIYSVNIRRFQSLDIYGPEAKKIGRNAMQLPPDALMASDTHVLAKVCVGLMGSYVEGHLYNVQGAGVQNGRLVIEGKRSFQLRSKDGTVTSGPLFAKIG